MNDSTEEIITKMKIAQEQSLEDSNRYVCQICKHCGSSSIGRCGCNQNRRTDAEWLSDIRKCCRIV